MILDTLEVDGGVFGVATGWEIKSEGACRGEVCVPLGDGDSDVQDAAERLRMAVVRDRAHGVWAIGPATVGGRALASAEAPELVLPDVDGNEFRLSSLRGKKVVLVAWAPY